ncbi:MFS transporter [Campylobacter sp. 2018MI35]|uniref:MFS transporter n=1 Tax=Campylobacter sp. 2018MI34 TaxID=2800582 RepID=UPI001908998D|nr:MFS transporter [Campylobacter sp. 2018MI34]MBK1991612.1 MFS transporter [Campylobacter sp. 2018MI34]
MKNKKIKNIVYASLGGILEFYDFILFVFFLDIFIKIFFPPQDESFLKFSSYLLFGIAYLIRPLGAIFMGHFGDKVGRKKIFYISMLLMILPNFVIAFLPNYESIGIIAPIILFFMRILQGLAIGAEVSGSWVFVSEFVRGRQIPLALGFISMTLTFGLLLGGLTFIILKNTFSENELESYAWRIPFIISAIFGFLALFLRKHLDETPIFEKIKKNNQILKFPLKQAFKTHKTSMLVCFLMSVVLTSAIATLMILPKYFHKVLSLNNTEALYIQNWAIFILMIGSLIQGILAKFFGSYKICIIFSLMFIVFSLLFSLYNDYFILFYFLACFSQGIVTFAPVFMTQIFKNELKFSGLSFAYNISYAILSFITPFIVDLFFNTYLKFYFIFVGSSALVCVFLLKYFLAKNARNIF